MNDTNSSIPAEDVNRRGLTEKVRVFIAYAAADLTYAKHLSRFLIELGFDVRLIAEIEIKGNLFEQQIKDELLLADALIVLWSNNSGNRDYLLTEAAFFAGAAPNKPLIPIILDDAQIPTILGDRLFIRVQNALPEEVALEVGQELSRLEGARIKKKQAFAVQKEIVERTADKYIAQAITTLTKREQKYQWLAFFGFFIGYISLVGGLMATIHRFWYDKPSFGDIPASIYTGVLTLSAIGFLAAAAKYPFVLGRSFMMESLRNNDRIHAIRFGEFYLKAFSENVTWTELKEAFQYWNVDTGSGFKDQKEQEIDPQILKSLTALLETIKK